MEEEYPVDFEMMNYYISSHPASYFTHNIVASAVIQEGRVNIMNQGVRIIRNGIAEPAYLADRKALRSLVVQHFGFDLPELETMRVDGVPGWQSVIGLSRRCGRAQGKALTVSADPATHGAHRDALEASHRLAVE